MVLVASSLVVRGHDAVHDACLWLWFSLAPRIKAKPGRPGDTDDAEAQEQLEEEVLVEWVDMYEEAGVFGSATCAIGVGCAICFLAIRWVFSSSSMAHEIVYGENGGVGAD